MKRHWNFRLPSDPDGFFISRSRADSSMRKLRILASIIPAFDRPAQHSLYNGIKICALVKKHFSKASNLFIYSFFVMLARSPPGRGNGVTWPPWILT